MATKKTTTKKSTTATKKSTTKKAPAKSTKKTAKTSAAKRVTRPAAKTMMTTEERQQQISIAAYLRAEHRGFAPGGELEDWVQAEREIDAAADLSA